MEGVVRDNEETRKNHSGCQAQSQGLSDILLPFGAYTATPVCIYRYPNPYSKLHPFPIYMFFSLCFKHQ